MRTFREIIDSYKGFLVISHYSPDGDAIGCEAGLGLFLGALGKDVWVVNEDPVPQRYRFLPGTQLFMQESPPKAKYEVIFLVDASERSRVGIIGEKIPWDSKLFVNIDHHKSNSERADILFVDNTRSSCAEIVFELMKGTGYPISKEIATCLYTGLLADTGRFLFPSTDARSLKCAYELVELGVDPGWVAQKAFAEDPLPKVLLMSLILSTLKLEDGIATMYMTQAMLEEANALYEYTENFASIPLTIKGVEVGIFLRERDNDRIKVSMRSRGDIDVDEICRQFGGGGHKSAAGCIVEGRIEEVMKMLVSVVREVMK